MQFYKINNFIVCCSIYSENKLHILEGIKNIKCTDKNKKYTVNTHIKIGYKNLI